MQNRVMTPHILGHE